ncbi:hypothetical protein RR46_13284 [Papilio xuthus]|uniref:Uncharacterized protein n=1 Tax=Papilio xuthus TaxID=66420 RepID=A0A194PGB0_PAPXU|nr:hypothetical protein RR46_13284 [Papilio xuthus]
MVPAIIGAHYGWAKLQGIDYLVGPDDRKKLPFASEPTCPNIVDENNRAWFGGGRDGGTLAAATCVWLEMGG